MSEDKEIQAPLDPWAFDAVTPEAIAIDQIPFDVFMQNDEQKAHELSLLRFQESL